VATVYLVTSGEYSDYGIRAAFSTKEKAQEWIDSWDGKGIYGHEVGDFEIEEWALDDWPMAGTRIRVRMSRDGQGHAEQPFVDSDVGFCCFDVHGCLTWDVATNEPERAIKVTNEKRVQIIALNLWGNHDECRKLFGGRD
jgi:hypothetical protein